METRTIRSGTTVRRRMRLRMEPSNTDTKISEITGNTVQNLFENSLRRMAHTLKPGCCSSAGHSNCVMNVEAVGEDSEGLLLDFLSKTLELTHSHKTIFCTMNVKQLTKNKLIAQVFGRWFDTLDNRIKSVKDYGFSSKRGQTGLFQSTVILEFEVDATNGIN